MKFSIILVSAILLSFLTTPVSAHLSEEMLSCPVFSKITQRHGIKKMQETMAEQGLLGEVYDITGDGRPDLAVYSPTLGGLNEDGSVFHKDEVLFYEIDNDGDASADVLYINVDGLNDCNSLILYKELPHHEQTKGGLINWTEPRPDLLYDGRALEEHYDFRP